MGKAPFPGTRVPGETKQIKIPGLELTIQMLTPPASLEKQILSQLAGAFIDCHWVGLS